MVQNISRADAGDGPDKFINKSSPISVIRCEVAVDGRSGPGGVCAYARGVWPAGTSAELLVGIPVDWLPQNRTPVGTQWVYRYGINTGIPDGRCAHFSAIRPWRVQLGRPCHWLGSIRVAFMVIDMVILRLMCSPGASAMPEYIGLECPLCVPYALTPSISTIICETSRLCCALSVIVTDAIPERLCVRIHNSTVMHKFILRFRFDVYHGGSCLSHML